MSSHEEINSFAVFDLETTGLPDYNFNKANITELTMHGFPADAVASGNRRVNHSLTLLFNPRMRIHPDAEKITGLNNYMLEHESHFNNNAANTIIGFLEHLRQPVCLVAHNGDKFDFPILKAAFEKLEMNIPSNVLCLDSYEAIKMLDRNIAENKTTLAKDCLSENADFKLNTIPFLNDDDASSNISNSTGDATPLKISVDDFKKPDETVDNVNTENITKQQTGDATPQKIPKDDFKKPDDTLENINTENITSQDEEKDIKHDVDWQKINETTPKQGINKSQKLCRKRQCESPPPNRKPTPRRLDYTTPIKPPVGFYKLENIYVRLFGEQPKVTHQAEADVILLKEIMFKYGDSFVKLAEENARPFSLVEPLGIPTKNRDSITNNSDTATR